MLGFEREIDVRGSVSYPRFVAGRVPLGFFIVLLLTVGDERPGQADATASVSILRAYASGEEVGVSFVVRGMFSWGHASVRLYEARGAGALFQKDILVDANGLGLAEFKSSATGPLLADFALTDRNGRQGPSQSVAIDLDWLPECPQELLSEDHEPEIPYTLDEVEYCRVIRPLVRGPSDGGAWARVQEEFALPINAKIFIATEGLWSDFPAELEARGPYIFARPTRARLSLQIHSVESAGGYSHVLALAPSGRLIPGVDYSFALQQPMQTLVCRRGDLGNYLGRAGDLDVTPPVIHGLVEALIGPGASVFLRFPRSEETLPIARLTVTRGRATTVVVLPINERIVKLGCVGCSDSYDLPEDADLTLMAVVVDAAGNPSLPVPLSVRTPRRLDGRNGDLRRHHWRVANTPPGYPPQGIQAMPSLVKDVFVSWLGPLLIRFCDTLASYFPK